MKMTVSYRICDMKLSFALFGVSKGFFHCLIYLLAVRDSEIPWGHTLTHFKRVVMSRHRVGRIAVVVRSVSCRSMLPTDAMAGAIHKMANRKAEVGSRIE